MRIAPRAGRRKAQIMIEPGEYWLAICGGLYSFTKFNPRPGAIVKTPGSLAKTSIYRVTVHEKCIPVQLQKGGNNRG